jgi:predicted ester cyclase
VVGSNREAFERGHDLFNSHEVDGLLELYADDAELKGPGGMSFRGKDAIAGFLRGWYQGFPDCRTESTNVIEAGDTIVEEGVFTGTHTGVFPTPMGDIPPTGKRVEGNYVDVFEFRDGKLVSDRLIFDRMQLMEQLGLVPEPAGAGA